MCFSIRKTVTVAKIAEADIPCLKILGQQGKKLLSPSRAHSYTKVWKVNVPHKEPDLLRIRFKNGSRSIDKGLHSKKSFLSTVEWTRWRNDRAVYKAVIRRGSLYWENATDYVSDALEIVDKNPVSQKEANKYLKGK